MPLGGDLAGAPPAPQGMPYPAMIAAQRRMRVRQNLQPLGITWILLGVYRFLTGLVGAIFMHSFATSGMFGDAPGFMPHLFHALVPVVAATTVVMSAASFLVGYALLTKQSWGRIIAIIFAILSLIKLPFGTAVGIYTLWVLAPGASAAEWDAISREG